MLDGLTKESTMTTWTRDRKTGANSTFAKWRVEEVLVHSVFNLTFVASRQVAVPNPPIRKSAKRYAQCYDDRQDSNHKVIGGLSTSRLRLDIDFNFKSSSSFKILHLDSPSLTFKNN
jgi:hypothetical protein